MGWFLPGHTTSKWCVWFKKMPKIEFLKNTKAEGVSPTNSYLDSVSPMECVNELWPSGYGKGLPLRNFQVPLFPGLYI